MSRFFRRFMPWWWDLVAEGRRDRPKSIDKLRAKGARMANFIQYPDLADCKEYTQVTFNRLSTMAKFRSQHLPGSPSPPLGGLGELIDLWLQPTVPDLRSWRLTFRDNDGRYTGRTGQHVMIIDYVTRPANHPTTPHVGAVFNALYQHTEGSLDSLRHVYLAYVVNQQTHKLLKTYGRGIHLFVHGSPDYEAILGTRTGCMVASIILGGFPRGTRRITQIAGNDRTGEGYWDMRFDIEAI
ncbi:hypothetical protein N7478_001927 [Penicillium angulare]|uniref:uncharacterized protein n=1 Tax=Penicillium angulare TaxID=116970 RepID=UPI0025415C24|nr:uncharacterized protein N7478_001927 [Penicillium angulare]KAJ5288897.1 hypothetical protein N7478_001927 [Penicillium angulare]